MVRRTSHPDRSDLLTISAGELAALIRTKRVTSRQAVETHVAQVRRVNGRLNAMVKDRFDDALREADEADAAIQRGADLPPLHGVPCGIKECFAMTGMPNTSGLVARKGIVADRDATAVKRLREAGAIPLGVSNVSELCMWMESVNKVYGRTGSAFDPTRTAGGSSGGEGALVGAGAVPFGLGSDVGGSIRMPAFFNGVFGHKPTGGLVPGSGQYPEENSQVFNRYTTTGPLTRRADDLFPILRILAGPDGIDPGAYEMPLGDPGKVSLEGLRVLDVRETIVMPVAKSLLEAQSRAAAALARRGAKLESRRFPALRQGIALWSSMLEAAGTKTFKDLLGNGNGFHIPTEILRAFRGRSPHTVAALGLAVLEELPKLMPSRASEAVEVGRALQRELEEALGDDGVLLFPPHAVPAPKHVVSLVPPLRWGYTSVWNVLELPSTAVPMGLDARGVPLGVQVISRRGNDHVTIAVAQALEREVGGWRMPAWIEAA